jgi:hypothetical protein
MRAAEKLKEALWGKELEGILKKKVIEGTTWKYVPGHWVESLEMRELGYLESGGLLVRPEYDNALATSMFDGEWLTKQSCRGVVVTGQPGIGMLSSLIIEQLPLNAH